MNLFLSLLPTMWGEGHALLRYDLGFPDDIYNNSASRRVAFGGTEGEDFSMSFSGGHRSDHASEETIITAIFQRKTRGYVESFAQCRKQQRQDLGKFHLRRADGG